MSQDYTVDPSRRRSSVSLFVKNVQVQLHGKGHTMAVPFSLANIITVAGIFSLLPLVFPFSAIILVGILLSIAVVVVDFLSVWEPAWDLKTAIRQYVMVRLFYLVGMYKSWQFHCDSQHVRKTQESTLLRFLKLNSDTTYATDHNFKAITSATDYVKSQPLIKYPAIQSYIERMANGEEKVLTSDPPVYFNRTSGTTGQPSFIPFTKTSMRQQICAVALFDFNAGKQLPWYEKHRLRPVWKLSYTPDRIISVKACGVMAGPMSANPLWTSKKEIYTCPTMVFKIEDQTAGSYIQLVFALRYRQLGAIDGFFASNVYYAFQHLERQWQSLVEDIRNGSLPERLQIKPEARAQLLSYLSPDPARADELETEFQRGFDNIAIRIWPELEIINCITTGPFKIYAQYLKQRYTKDILLYPPGLAASEGLIGLNFWPHVQPSRFALLPREIFYEFIPMEKSSENNPETLLIDQVKLGQEYELVITTIAGLYRYRMGDIVKVVSYYNQCPVIEFMTRAAASLNIKGEKVSDTCIYTALTEVVKVLNPVVKDLVDYTSCESVLLEMVEGGSAEGRSYAYHVIFVELKTDSDANQSEILKQFSHKYDEFIRKGHFRYKEHRELNTLGLAEIIRVKSGAFDRLREYMVKTTGASPVQLKIPRVLLKAELLRFLLSERESTK